MNWYTLNKRSFDFFLNTISTEEGTSSTGKKEFTFLKPRFYIKSTMGNYTIDGNIFTRFPNSEGWKEVAYVAKMAILFGYLSS